MDFLTNLGWLGKSFAAMLGAVPLLVFYGYFVRLGLKPEAVIYNWLLGCALGILLLSTFSCGLVQTNPKDLFTPLLPTLMVIAAGVVFGAAANALMGLAIATAPNQGIPFAIAGCASAAAYVITPVLGTLLPAWFNRQDFSWINLTGILGIAVCMWLAMYKTQ